MQAQNGLNIGETMTKPNGNNNLTPGHEKHGGYLLVNRGIVRESNADVAAAMEQLQNHLFEYVGGEPDAVQSLLISAIVPSFGFKSLVERHVWQTGVLVQEGKKTRMAPPLKESYWSASNSMVRAAKALAETVAQSGKGEPTIDLSTYIKQREAGTSR
jgi:hypothetical protein